MCTTMLYESKTCKHKWMAINKSCGYTVYGYKKGFTTCDAFDPKKGIVTPTPSKTMAAPRTCPECDRKGYYDGNQVRMVASIKKSICVVM